MTAPTRPALLLLGLVLTVPLALTGCSASVGSDGVTVDVSDVPSPDVPDVDVSVGS